MTTRGNPRGVLPLSSVNGREMKENMPMQKTRCLQSMLVHREEDELSIVSSTVVSGVSRVIVSV